MKKLLAAVFNRVTAGRNRRFDSGRTKIERAAGPVISVGNIQVGGTGKTPFVQMLVRMLQELGKRPAVLARGYGRKSSGLLVVSDGVDVRADVSKAGDELYLHARTLNVPVVAEADRAVGAAYIFENFEVDVVVLDDGFQHRRLHRDLDILMCDAQTLQEKYVLPAGRLREALPGLRRADVLVARDADICAELNDYHPAALCIHARSDLLAVRFADSGTETNKRSKKVLMLTGIAHPQRLRRSIEEAGYEVVEELTFRDHHAFEEKDINKAIELCTAAQVQNIMVSEKDEVKLQQFITPLLGQGLSLCVLPMRLTIDQGQAQFRERLEEIFDKGPKACE